MIFVCAQYQIEMKSADDIKLSLQVIHWKCKSLDVYEPLKVL